MVVVGGGGVYCYLHTLALQHETASAYETVTGTFSFLSRRHAWQVIEVKVGLHDAVFYGFP